MCTRVNCQRCGKPTWAGCGRHIEQALAGVPPEDRCHCGDRPEPKPPADEPPKRGLFKLF